MKDKRIEEIVKNILNLCNTSYGLGFPADSEEHKQYIRQTLLDFQQEIREETLSEVIEQLPKIFLKKDCEDRYKLGEMVGKKRYQRLVRKNIISTAKEKYNIILE